MFGLQHINNLPPDKQEEIKYFIERKNLEIQNSKERKSKELNPNTKNAPNQNPDYLQNILPKRSYIQDLKAIMIRLLKKKKLEK